MHQSVCTETWVVSGHVVCTAYVSAARSSLRDDRNELSAEILAVEESLEEHALREAAVAPVARRRSGIGGRLVRAEVRERVELASAHTFALNHEAH